MTYTNTPIVVSQQTTGYTSGNIPYSSIVLITGIPHAAQLEVERIFTQDRDGSTGPLLAFLADPAVTTAQKKAVFTIPISRCTLDSITSNITAIDLPASGATVYNYVITTPTPNTYTIKIPSLNQHGSSTVTVRRKTVSNEPFVNWQAGSRLTSKQLNLATTQSLYLIQEALEKIGTSVTIETTQITAASLSDNSVTTSAIASNAVTTAKIADSAVTTSKIADGTIVNADINASAAIDGSKISPVFTSASTFSSTLGVTGATTLSSTLGVTGATTIQGLTVGTGGGSISTNTALGLNALNANTTGYNNSAFGYAALDSNTTGNANNAFGYVALSSNTAGINNNAFGYATLNLNTTGYSNNAFGHAALSANTTGYNNNAFGHAALASNTTGNYNNAFGHAALNLNTSGNFNSAFGQEALDANTIGGGNSAFGYAALATNTTGIYNSAFGQSALQDNKTGTQNTAVGLNSLLLSKGNNNSGIGALAGSTITSGSNNLCVGFNAQASSATVGNEVSIYNSSVTARFQGAATSWTFVSDARDKENIENLNFGLDFINQLQPRKFSWNIRNSDVDKGKDASGFIAQELASVVELQNADCLGLVYTNNPNQFSIAQTNLIPVLVNAIKELNAKFEAYVATHP